MMTCAFLAMSLAAPGPAFASGNPTFQLGDVPQAVRLIKEAAVAESAPVPAVALVRYEEKSRTQPDVIARAVDRCPAANRRAFFAGIKFIGDSVASFRTAPLEDCPGVTSLDDVQERLDGPEKGDTRKGDCVDHGTCDRLLGGTCTKNCETGFAVAADGSPKELAVERLFSACGSAVRDEFYDRLEFRDGRLVSMYIGGIRQCGAKADIQRFLSIFGTKGIGALEWSDDQKCDHRGHCADKPNFSCNLETC